MKKFLIGLIFALAGCSHSTNDTREIPEFRFDYNTKRAEFLNYKDDVIYFRSGACLGWCPVFDSFLFPDGHLIFKGELYVKTKERKDIFLPASVFEIVSKNITELSETPAECETIATDHPQVLYISQVRGEVKTFYFYTGCYDFPEEERVDELLAENWRLLKIDGQKSRNP